ncbi:mechanosensitive ion channel family protein [Sneathiella sp.]|jgi:small-conductance mechanosensitive channel|uniref:mechanosensitive ion channel family protein n=1 Tax=Sneathiella sp. TaxID=1964365 RepID=UPI0039E3D2F5
MSGLWTSILKPRGWVTRLCLLLFVVGFFLLGYLDYLKPIQAFLDSDELAFKVGDIRFSLYALTKALIAIVIAFWLAGLVSEFGEKKIRSLQNIKVSNRALMTKAFQIGVYFLAFLIGLDVLGIDLTALAIFSGAVGIGVGFGLQKIASNFISGTILLLEKSVEEADLVELNDGTTGFVRNIGARYALVETFEGREIMVPNEDFITNRVTNWTLSNTRGRIDIHIGVSYGADLDLVKDLILEAALEHPRCGQNPPPEVFLVDFAESSVNFTLYFWVDDIIEGRKRPRSDVLFSIWRRFKEHGVEIPFPQRDVHIKSHEAPK